MHSATVASKPSYSLLDPNPDLIDIDSKLINNINLAANLTTHRNGTIADGISKLILIVESKSSLQFSIKDTNPDNPTNGTLSSFKQTSKDDNKSSSTAKDSPQNISNGKSVVAAVYTPPRSPLIKIQEVTELSMLMCQIQIILLGRFLKSQYSSTVLQ